VKALPPYIRQGSKLKFYIKLVKIETADQLQARQYALILQRRTDMEKMKNAEADSIHRYLTSKNIQVKPTAIDSLYILERTGTPGRPINEGDSVELKYTGMFLNGKIFDQSNRGDGGPGTYKIVYRHNAKLIAGWLDVLETMHQGETVRVLLPSSLAYGSYGAGKDIKPFTPLLFEIKVIKVSSPFEQ
jgi:FKBP-type peptidyl-prolyl cis-trans isomerase FkpA